MNYLLRPVLVLLLLIVGLAARAADVTALRSWRAPDNTRLVLDISAPVQFSISPDSTPAQLVLALDDSRSLVDAPHVQGGGPVRSVRFRQHDRQLQLVIDLGAEVSPKAFQLPPNEKYGQRLVLDLYDHPPVPPVVAVTVPSALAAVTPAAATAPAPAPAVPLPVSVPTVTASPRVATPVAARPAPAAAITSGVVQSPATSGSTVAAASSGPATPPASPAPAAAPQAAVSTFDKPVKTDATELDAADAKGDRRGRNIIIAIDAGHGGEDPGAIGLHGSFEKNVTLAIARQLYAQLKAAPGITPVLTRDGDYFIPLQDRRQIARYKDHADIFVSIHADSSPARSAKGASVFALSLKGANTATSRFARMLAERENRADLIGGVAVEKDDGDSVLRNVLADMVVTGSLEHSLHMAHDILDSLVHVSRLHSEQVEQAGFAVLKEPGMVSLLVETGFISNPAEEKRLTDPVHQKEIAHAIFLGARHFCEQFPIPGTYFAWLSEQRRVHGPEHELASSDDAAAGGGKVEDPALSRDQPHYARHRISSGENLTVLASRYQTTPHDLKELNDLDDDMLRIGQVIKVPVN